MRAAQTERPAADSDLPTLTSPETNPQIETGPRPLGSRHRRRAFSLRFIAIRARGRLAAIVSGSPSIPAAAAARRRGSVAALASDQDPKAVPLDGAERPLHPSGRRPRYAGGMRLLPSFSLLEERLTASPLSRPARNSRPASNSSSVSPSICAKGSNSSRVRLLNRLRLLRRDSPPVHHDRIGFLLKRARPARRCAGARRARPVWRGLLGMGCSSSRLPSAWSRSAPCRPQTSGAGSSASKGRNLLCGPAASRPPCAFCPDFGFAVSSSRTPAHGRALKRSTRNGASVPS